MSTLVCRAASVSLTGLEGEIVTVEAAVSQQLPGMAIIGLPDAALAEAKQRVRTATAQAGLQLADRFITVNLSPASLPKHGSGFDLAIALAALAASRKLPASRLDGIAHLGELSLSGGLRRPAGLLSAVIAARRHGFSRVMVPGDSADEAALVPGIKVIAVEGIAHAVAWYRGERGALDLRRAVVLPGPGSRPEVVRDLSEVVGQPESVEALVVAAAGKHHVSMVGPPGAGKTLLATGLPSILPELDDDEALEASSIASLGGDPLTSLVRRPPFESPHHTASSASIVGGGTGNEVRPGAITRACHGVLFIDEAPEFNRSVLDALRQPLETGRVEIHRARVRATMPARVQLVLAANPCPCGNAGAPETEAKCRCTPHLRHSYMQRISGPLADRIDLRLSLARVSRVLRDDQPGGRQDSRALRARVERARRVAAKRLRGTPWRVNSEVPGSWLRSSDARLERTETQVLDRALERGSITLRGYDRVLRMAWSIADLSEQGKPGRKEIASALAYRGGGLS